MKVTLSENLELKVQAETDVEALALRYWIENFPKHLHAEGKSKLMVLAEIERKVLGCGKAYEPGYVCHGEFLCNDCALRGGK